MPSLNETLGMHWGERARLVKSQKDQVCWCFRLARKKPPPGPWVVSLHRIGKGALDTDNLGGAFKAVRDQIAKELGTDDAPNSPIQWEYSQSICRKDDQPSIKITIATAS